MNEFEECRIGSATVIEGYAAINQGDGWKGVIAGDKWCEKLRSTSKEALNDAKIKYENAKRANEKYFKMDNVYREINNAEVLLEIDNDDLIIRILYIPGDAQNIINELSEGDD